MDKDSCWDWGDKSHAKSAFQTHIFFSLNVRFLTNGQIHRPTVSKDVVTVVEMHLEKSSAIGLRRLIHRDRDRHQRRLKDDSETNADVKTGWLTQRPEFLVVAD